MMATKECSLLKYKITAGYDRQPHIYEYDTEHYHENPPNQCDLDWEGLFIHVNPDYLSHVLHCYYADKHQGDEIEILGRKLVILKVEYNTGTWLCTLADAVGYRLLLHTLIFDLELYKLVTFSLKGMSNQMQNECWQDRFNAY